MVKTCRDTIFAAVTPVGANLFYIIINLLRRTAAKRSAFFVSFFSRPEPPPRPSSPRQTYSLPSCQALPRLPRQAQDRPAISPRAGHSPAPPGTTEALPSALAGSRRPLRRSKPNARFAPPTRTAMARPPVPTQASITASPASPNLTSRPNLRVTRPPHRDKVKGARFQSHGAERLSGGGRLRPWSGMSGRHDWRRIRHDRRAMGAARRHTCICESARARSFLDFIFIFSSIRLAFWEKASTFTPYSDTINFKLSIQDINKTIMRK